MIRRKETKSVRKRRGKAAKHETLDPRIQTAEGWWRHQGREQGKSIRPIPREYEQ